MLNSTSPLFVFFITCFFTRHEAIGLIKLAGVSLGVFGVVQIVGTVALQGLSQQLIAQMAVLLGAMMYAVAAIYGKNSRTCTRRLQQPQR